ncbi:MAG: hypothetical protein ABII24_04080 [bacterium]
MCLKNSDLLPVFTDEEKTVLSEINKLLVQKKQYYTRVIMFGFLGIPALLIVVGIINALDSQAFADNELKITNVIGSLVFMGLAYLFFWSIARCSIYLDPIARVNGSLDDFRSNHNAIAALEKATMLIITVGAVRDRLKQYDELIKDSSRSSCSGLASDVYRLFPQLKKRLSTIV